MESIEAIKPTKKFRQNQFPILQQVTFMEDKSLPYSQAIRLLFRAPVSKAEKAKDIFKLIEEMKSHSLNMTGDTGGSAGFVRQSADLKMLQERLSDDEVVIEFYYEKEFSVTFLISKNEISLEFFKELGERHIENLIDALIDGMTNPLPDSEETIIVKGFDLFSTLIEPHIKNGVELKGKKVYLIPHRQLNYLPLECSKLFERQPRKFLLD